MKKFNLNHYERAFETWLIDNRVEYSIADEHKRATFGPSNIKSFDFLLHPPSGQTIIAEVKGRLFKGKTLEKLAGLECWVTTDDVDGLAGWQQAFGPGHTACFVFAYKVENVDVDFDGRDFHNFDDNRYVFFAVGLDDYRKFMKTRSPKWKTITLPAETFRQCAVQMQNLLF